MRRVLLLLAPLLLVASPVDARILYQSGLDANPNGSNPDYSYDCRTDCGATHTWLADGGWSGGAAKITPCTSYGNTCGIQSGFSASDPAYMRFLYRAGPRFYDTPIGDKLLMFSRTTGNDGHRYIGTLQESSARQGGPAHHLLMGRNINFCTDPGVHSGFFLEDAGTNQWVAIEVMVDVANNAIRIWVTTEDGQFNEKLVMESSAQHPDGWVWNTRLNPPAYSSGQCGRSDWGSGSWDWFLLGGFWDGAHNADSQKYVLFDEIVVADQYIGPPPGFVTGGGNGTTPPPPPGNVDRTDKRQ